MVSCVKCGKHLVKECKCFTNNLERIKEWKRLARREIDVIIEVLENNKPLFMRLANGIPLTVQASILPLRNGIKASASFALDKPDVRHFKRIEILDWNKKFIYWRPEDITLERTKEDKTIKTHKWILGVM